MALIPATRQSKDCHDENLAALLFLVAAQQRDGGTAAVHSLLERWRELKKAIQADP